MSSALEHLNPLITPVANLNGNSASDLVYQIVGIMNVLQVAQKSFGAASDVVHGRNFQHLLKPGDSSEHSLTVRDAQQAWAQRVTLLEDMRKELEALALAIQNGEAR